MVLSLGGLCKGEGAFVSRYGRRMYCARKAAAFYPRRSLHGLLALSYMAPYWLLQYGYITVIVGQHDN